MHTTAYLALGTNMPHRGVAGADLLQQAVRALRAAGLQIRALSGVWQTAAWPRGVNQPDYYNAVVSLDAGDLSPGALYQLLRQIEAGFGRVRRERWAARTLDLDILAMEGFVGAFGDIELPHPRLHERSFVLAPLAEIAPGWLHPGLEKTAAALLAALPAGTDYRRVDDLATGQQ